MGVTIIGIPTIIDHKIKGVIYASSKQELVPDLKIGDDTVDVGSFAVTATGEAFSYDFDKTWKELKGE